MAASMFGDDYVAEVPRRYDRKVKNAQEAHEAIRPAGESFRSLDEAQGQLGGDELAVYDLVWKRTIASQMVDARLTQDKVRLTTTLAGITELGGDVQAGLSATGCASSFRDFAAPTSRGWTIPKPSSPTRKRILPH